MTSRECELTRKFVVKKWKIDLINKFFNNQCKSESEVAKPCEFEDCEVSSIIDNTKEEVIEGDDAINSSFAEEIAIHKTSSRNFVNMEANSGDVSKDAKLGKSLSAFCSKEPNYSPRENESPESSLLTSSSYIDSSQSSSVSDSDKVEKVDVKVSSSINETSELVVNLGTTLPLNVSSEDLLANIENVLACSPVIDESTSHKASIATCRPKVVRKIDQEKPVVKSIIPPVSNPDDQGSNCVSVILKSSRLDGKPARLASVKLKLKQVETLVSRFNLKSGYKSSFGVQVRLDYTFYFPSDARQFFKDLNSLEQSQSPPKLLSCMLMQEVELGYQHEPVLSEHDLLAIQSPAYCRNLFRTSVSIKVTEDGGIVFYHFNNVTDVNRFLFNKSGNSKARSLGSLRINVSPKRIVPDGQGFYRLFTKERGFSRSVCEKYHFKVTQRMEFGNACTLKGGNLLLFSNKLNLFKFLVCEDAADLDHLQFDEALIMNSEEDQEQEVCANPENVDTECSDIHNASKIDIEHALVYNDLDEIEVAMNDAKRMPEVPVKECDDAILYKEDFTSEAIGEIDVKKVDNQISSKELKERLANEDEGLLKVANASVHIEIRVKHEVAVNSDEESVVVDDKCSRTTDEMEVKEVDINDNCTPITSTKVSDDKELVKKVLFDNLTEHTSFPIEKELLKKEQTCLKNEKQSLKLAKKDEEIVRLKKKILLKEQQIENEIKSKAATMFQLEEALSKLDRINNLSLSFATSP